MPQMTCPSCASPVIDGMIFCDNCGFDLRTEEPSETVPGAAQLASPPAAASELCPVCQHLNRSGAVFCENCGTALTPTSTAPAGALFSPNPLPVYEPPFTPPGPTAFRAYLLIPGANINLDLPPGKSEFIIGREDEISGVFPEINLEPFGGQEAGVSRRHLKLWNVSGNWMVEDLNTVNGTFLNRQRLDPNQPAQLKPGDELRLGRLALIFKQD